MRILLTFFSLFLGISASINAQEKEYPSKQMDRYYKKAKKKLKAPTAPDDKVVLQFQHPVFSLSPHKGFTPYADSLYNTPYQDSLYTIISQTRDWEDLPDPIMIGIVDKSNIIKFGTKGALQAMIFSSYDFDNGDIGSKGIFVGFSRNNGTSWKYYYSGLTQNRPLYLKWYSNLPLINSDSTLQIEGALLNIVDFGALPCCGPVYKTAKDGLRVILNLNELKKDSDNDGLTNIEEEKLFLDPFNADTDGDGVSDKLDLNPRSAKKSTNKTALYQELISGEPIDWLSNYFISDSSFNEEDAFYLTDTSETVIMVAETKDVWAIRPKSRRIIIVTSKDAKNARSKFHNSPEEISYSPLFKVDGEKDLYLMNYSEGISGGTYLIKRVENGWLVDTLSWWVI